MCDLRRITTLLFLCTSFFYATTVVADTAGRVVFHDLPSPAVEGENQSKSLAVYLPAEYQNTDDRYPLLILLHHYPDGNHETFLGMGYPIFDVLADEINVADMADLLISNGRSKPMIIAMPDFSHDFRYNAQYDDYIPITVLEYLRSNFRVSENREDIVVAGHFWSGRNAIEIAFAHEDLFGKVVAYSPCLTFAIPSLIERSYDRDFPVTFHFYQTNFNIRYGTGSCSDRFSRKYADTLIDLDIEVHLENYDSDQYVTLPQQIEHTLQTVF